MLQDMSNQQQFYFGDENFNAPANNEIKFPKIDRPSSKMSSKPKKTQVKFPTLKIQSNPLLLESMSENDEKSLANNQLSIERKLYAETESKQQKLKQEESNFVNDISKKLKMVLEEQNIVDIEESDGDSDDQDFQKKINQNKEIIKMHKLRKETEEQNSNTLNHNAYFNDKKMPPPKKSKPVSTKNQKFRSRNESLYEKRAKQYRDTSIENKYLQKKKEEIALKIAKQSFPLRDQKTKQSQSVQKILPNKIFANNKPKNKNSSLQREPIYETVNTVGNSGNQQLFDKVQSFLENPVRTDDSTYIKVIKKSDKYRKSNKELLEAKIKKIQEKLKSGDYAVLNHDETTDQNKNDKNLTDGLMLTGVPQSQDQTTIKVPTTDSNMNWLKLKLGNIF